MDHFRYIKIQLDSEAKRQTNKRNKETCSLSFLCLCPLGLAAKLNFDISKVFHCVDNGGDNSNDVNYDNNSDNYEDNDYGDGNSITTDNNIIVIKKNDLAHDRCSNKS